MKIIILHDADARIEILNVADNLIKEDIEMFLSEHGYSVNNITWMAANIDNVPVTFHEYGTIAETGEELHLSKEYELKDRSFYHEVKYIKKREADELINAMRNHGEKVDDGYELHFEDDEPIIAGYLFDEPCDIIIKAVKVDNDGYLTILGEDKQDRSEVHEIDEDEFFAGQLDYVIEKVQEFPINH